MKTNQRKSERTSKRIAAITTDKKTLVIDNISFNGGYLKTREKKTGQFTLKLLINNYKEVELECVSRWDNEQGLGFEIVSIQKNKEKFFNEFVNRQIQLVKQLGDDRVFRKDIFINLGETNATGNVYFANYVKYQGVLRESCIVHHIPNINEIMAQTGIKLVTVDVYQKFRQNAYFGYTITGELTVGQIKGCQAKLNFKYRNKADGELIGEGYQHFCCVGKSGKILKMPKLFEFMEHYIEV